MTVSNLAEKLNLRVVAGSGGVGNEVSCCYVGDLLSWVMGRAKEGSAWVTVMGNINAIAVATLADCACIILTESAPLDENARQKANMQNIPVLVSEKNSFDVAVAISKEL